MPRISVGVLVDLRVTSRTEKYEVVERICVERFIWSVLVTRARIPVRYHVRHLSNVRIATHPCREQWNETGGVLAMARGLRKQAQSGRCRYRLACSRHSHPIDVIEADCGLLRILPFASATSCSPGRIATIRTSRPCSADAPECDDSSIAALEPVVTRPAQAGRCLLLTPW